MDWFEFLRFARCFIDCLWLLIDRYSCLLILWILLASGGFLLIVHWLLLNSMTVHVDFYWFVIYAC